MLALWRFHFSLRLGTNSAQMVVTGFLTQIVSDAGPEGMQTGDEPWYMWEQCCFAYREDCLLCSPQGLWLCENPASMTGCVWWLIVWEVSRAARSTLCEQTAVAHCSAQRLSTLSYVKVIAWLPVLLGAGILVDISCSPSYWTVCVEKRACVSVYVGKRGLKYRGS